MTFDASQSAVSASHGVPSTSQHPVTLDSLRQAMRSFAEERDWGQYHTPRNLLLALTGEVGELAECFQWKGEVACGLPEFSPQERQHVGEELADVLLYLTRLADACGIDLGAAALDKMAKNAAKYPADQCRGRSSKYTEYQEAAEGAAADGQASGQVQQQQGERQEQQA